METNLKVKNFEWVPMDSYSGIGFFTAKYKDYVICLEPCLNGLDVAVYDKRLNLITDKVCLNETDRVKDTKYLMKRGVEEANKMLSRLINSRIGGDKQ